MARRPTSYAEQHKSTEAVTAHVLWMTTGLRCEGDSVAMTSATNPSLEDIITQAIPGMPKVVVHNQVIAYEVGDEFMQAWYDAEEGKLDPFVLVHRGLAPQREDQRRGPLGRRSASNPENGQPITTNEWVDRLAPKAAAVVRVGTCATYGGIPAMKNNPTGAMGVPDYLGWNWKSSAGLPVVCIPGCPAQPDNMTETLLYLALHLAGLAPAPELDEQLRPKWLFGRTVREGCNRAGFAEQGDFATEYGSDHRCLVKLGCKGPVVKCNVPVRGWVERHRRLPERRRHLHGLHDARLPRQVHAVHGRGPVGRRGGEHHDSSRYGPIVRYFRKRNIKNKYDMEPEWRHNRRRAHHRLRRSAGSAAGRARRQHGDSRDAPRSEGHGQGDVVGPDHPDRREPRDPHGDRLLQPAGPQVLLDVDDLPRIRHLHEGDRPARRALHHQPDLRHLR